MIQTKQAIECRSCGAAIVFLETVNGKKIPVDADTASPADKLFAKECGHISHFATCPAAQKHRRAR